ncbi:MAG: hypothetical protein C0510_05665 [Erythrobacter sp.]|nr:hypothetical protein [Erythrobacter sp.]
MSGETTYQVPQGPLRLAGPVVRPAPGTLPLRGDLAHIALAGTYLAAHYVIPHPALVADQGAALHAAPREGSDVLATLAGGTGFEVLDTAGSWVWGCLGPKGPSGYVKADSLAPISA